MNEENAVKWTRRGLKWGIGAIVVGVLAWNTLYVVPEGHLTVVKFTGKADRVESPGLKAKIPFLETIHQIEVRERKNVEKMAAATANQLPATATVSFNWTVNKESVLDLYIKYGSLAQFEDRVLDPRSRSAAKAAISRYRADQLIRERLTVVAEVQTELLTATAGLPITISQVNIENIDLPPTYMESILLKEQARENAEREKHALVQQKLLAQQLVQTAEAERDAVKAAADGRAYEKRVLAEAESFRVLTEYTGRSEGVKLLDAQLTPLYNDYIRAQAWNGKFPNTVLSTDSNVLFGIGGTGASTVTTTK